MALAEKIVLLEQKRTLRRVSEFELWEGLRMEASRLRDLFTWLRTEDMLVYQQLAEVLRDGVDGLRLQGALVEAIQCPLGIMRGSWEALELIEAAGMRCRPLLVADVLVACEFLGAALFSAHHIARANLPLMRDPSTRERWLAELTAELDRGRERLQRVRTALEVHHAAGSG
jgi:formiminotetrahydrofolate cyclodeaminase